MRVERPRPLVLRVTAHAHELGVLLAAARWAAEGAPGELPVAARAELERVLGDYDRALRDSTRPAAAP